MNDKTPLTVNNYTFKDEITRGYRDFCNTPWESFFKYFNDNSDVIEGILSKQQIRFTQPRALNDPLEFYPTIHFNRNEHNYQEYVLNGYPFPSVEMFTRNQLIESQINTYGILSFTKKPGSFEMWSQYANGHRGFVIEFKPDFYTYDCMKSTPDKYCEFGRVKYVDDYHINIDKFIKNGEINISQLNHELFFNKVSRWKLEDEYRLVRPLSDCPTYKPPLRNYADTDTNVYLFHFDISCINSVIIGASMTIEKKIKFIEFSKKFNIPILQAFIFRDIPDSDGKLCTVYPLGIDERQKELIKNTQPQLFCTDSNHFAFPGTNIINRIEELPYYKDNERIVEELYRNLQERPIVE
jgi:hypothetical protein